MPIKFQPLFTLSPKLVGLLLEIECVKEKVKHLPLTAKILGSLRESAKLMTTHYSTLIEGNRLTTDEVKKVLLHKGHFPGKELDEKEVKGYYLALEELEHLVARGSPITEKVIQTFHALVMGEGKKRVKPTPYRSGQNVIKDSQTGGIVYLPPEAKDVPGMMKGLIDWIAYQKDLPCPIVAGIAHYQYATIHPYYDGNGRTARLLTTLILHLGGYDLKGIYSLEEYYARNLLDYYRAITVGPSHNYYLGRAEGDITQWLEYFCKGVLEAFTRAKEQMEKEKTKGSPDQGKILRTLDPKKRKVLELFQNYEVITNQQVIALFDFKARTGAKLCQTWTQEGFLETVNPSRKKREYRLGRKYQKLIFL
jgi:Fic family protein